jgi:zinc protease
MRRWVAGVLLALATAHASAQVSGARDIEAVTLTNGMRIIVWPDRDIPSIALYNWVRVGSRNEAEGRTGIAHFFEHMMFNGTTSRAPGEFDRVLETNGARNNAFTSEDVTVYQDWFPTSALDVVLELEADRLRNLAFDPKVIESERGVVYSERRLSVDDNLSGRLQEQVQAAAFTAHPYGNPTIGWPSDIEAWQIEDLKHFFTTHYAPNNCTVVIVGDVDAKQMIDRMRQHFESIPAQPPPQAVRTIEPQQQGERRVTVEADAQTPILQFAYHGIAGNDERSAALELLTRILTDSDASRLHRTLVEEKKLAISADSYIQAGFDPGLVWFLLTLPSGGDVSQAEKAFDAEIRRIATESATASELTRARNQALGDFWRGLATVDGKARALGTYEVLKGGYKNLFNAPVTYRNVTTDQIQALAAQLLRANRRTVGVIVPPQRREHDEYIR